MKKKQGLLLSLLVFMVTATLLSCSDENIESSSPNNNPLATSLVGNWIGEYSAQGETTQGTNSVAGTYIKAVQGLEFKADGTGTYAKFLCNVASEPLSIFGGAMDQTNGRFHYTSDTNGTVSIILDGDGNNDNPKKWTLKYSEGGLSGTDGSTAYQLKTADENQKNMLADWEETLRSGGNSGEKSFLKDWQNCKEVYVNGLTNPVYLPWAGTAKNDIPEDVLYDHKKEAGWEMAFCCLNDTRAPQTRYFGLYNRFRGILRIYMYIPNASAYGNELGFNVNCGRSIKNGYPFFNAMMYGIPANKPFTSWTQGMDLATGTSKYKPLSWFLTPYSEKTKADGVSVYWHCFDIDMSGYVPPTETTAWKSHIDSEMPLLSLQPVSQNTSDIKLTGRLLGKMEGTFEDPKIKSSPADPNLHAAKIAFNFMGNIFQGITSHGAQAANIYNVYNAQANHEHLHGSPGVLSSLALGGGLFGVACSSVGALLNEFDKQKTEVVKPGVINLNLDANIDMTGHMSSWNSLDAGGMQVTPDLLKSTNRDCHIGEGCFGLEESPVVCIAKEDLLSETPNVNLTIVRERYSAGSEEENERYALRFITFLDPNSIKINLNTDIYHDIENLTVTAYCAVNTSMETGNTDTYRKLIKLNERPTLSFPEPNPRTPNLIALNTKSSMRLHNISCDDVLKGCPFAFPDNTKSEYVKLVKQKGDEVYRYYGMGSDLLGYNIMVEPQAYLPFSGFDFKKPVAPDIIVPVIVTFDCREHKGVMLVKQFIPDFKLVSRSELSTYYTQLQEFEKKSKGSEVVGRVHNAESLEYKSNSYLYMTRALNTLKAVTGK